MVNYNCKICGKVFNKKSNYLQHSINKKKPCQSNNNIQNKDNEKLSQIITKNTKFSENDKKITSLIIKNENKCLYCLKNFANIYNLKRHMDKYCKVKKLDKEKKYEKLQENNINLQEEVKELKKKLNIKKEITNMNYKLKKLENIIPIKQTKFINDKLLNIIINKDKKIEELKNKMNLINNNISHDEKKYELTNNNSTNLIFNNQVIMYRESDKYINATQLCKAGNKKFNDWFRLDSTKELINQLEKNLNILNYKIIDLTKSKTTSEAINPASQLVESKKGNSLNFEQGTWIHPDLAIQLAQWINPKFAIQVSCWIRNLFIHGKVEIEQIVKDKEKKIKILQDMILKKQRRTNYPDLNVIYLLTTEDNKNKGIYIVGKAINLKDRLSSYNKTCEHEVVYYKSCKTEEEMDLCEKIILNKLDKFREIANRDRFILPSDEDIQLFINIIDKCINIFD